MWLYLAFMGLLTLTLVIWLVIALADHPEE